MKCAGYPVELRPARDDGTGGWIAIVPEHPQFISCAATQQEALALIDQKLNKHIHQRPKTK